MYFIFLEIKVLYFQTILDVDIVNTEVAVIDLIYDFVFDKNLIQSCLEY
jgi:hypothetical protein